MVSYGYCSMFDFKVWNKFHIKMLEKGENV